MFPPPQPEAPTVQVLSPNGGEILQAGSPYEINWTASETIQNVTITLSYYADATTQNYVVAAVTANDGVFIWDSIPTSVIGQFCRIAVSDAGGSGASDGSDSGFTIVAPAQPQPEVPTIQVISPNGGENIQVGSSYEINWVASSSITNVKIALSTNAGGTYTDIVSGEANDGAYIWMVDTQQLTSKFCRIRISDADPTNSTASDASDMSFTIASQAEVPPEDDTIQVVSPNGGETWRAGDPCEINWIASDSITRVNIELTYFAGGSMNTHAITQAVDNTGVYIWPSIPGSVVGNFCRITVSDAGTSGVADTSDASFTIGASAQPQPEVPTIQVISPNGGETWQSGQARDVTWQASTSIQEVKIELTYFAQNEVKTHTIAAETPNVGTYTWQPIPLDAIGKFCRIRISDADPNTSISDESDASFTINEGPIIQITSPNGGEVWERGTDREITWNASSSIQDVVISLYQLNPDGTVLKWITITPAVAANTGRYLWTDIPAGAIGMRNRIPIDTLAGVVPRITDISDHNFTIQEDCITLGCVLNRILASSSDDSDNDSIPDDVEAMLGSDPNDHDSDHDGVFDYTELFQNWSFDDHESIPDADGDNLIAALDADDNGDGIPDSQQVDSDSDGITNSLELYGYTYDWGTGQYAAWDGDQSVDYYKSDPYQKSSDQDPFDDNVEVSGLGMDVTVDEPGSLPMVPAFPDIAVRLEGYAVALNKEITWSQGESLGEGSEWSRSVEASHSHTSESNWETGVEVGMKFEFESIIPSFECEVKTHQNWGGSSSQTNSTTTAHSTGGSILSEKNWSKATTTNPTDAAHMKLFLKVYNNGTAVASNIIPTFTLKIGGHNIATFEQGNAQINLLEPGGVYPASPGVYWVVDSIDTGAGVAPISLTLDELKALESGAPVSITVTQALADVMQRNLQTGVYESVGDWGEYKARIEAVSALVFADLGDGNYIRSHVYADDGPTAPVVTVGDALLWATGGYFDPDGNLVVRYRDYRTGWVEERTIAQEGLGNTWTLALDSRTYEANGLTWDETTGVWDPPVTEPQNLRLNPDSLLILKAPSEEVFGGGEPSIHSAYFDRSVGAVFVSADDYTGVKTVAFIDKNSNSTDMYEWVQGASFYVYYPVDYDFDGTETVCATNMNDAQTCSEITGVYLAETPPPVIDSVVYDRSNPGEVKIIAEVEWRDENDDFKIPAWVRVYHEALRSDAFGTGGLPYVEMEYVGGPYTSRYRWTVTMPANWPADAYQVTVVAYGGYGELFSEYAVAASDVRREHAFAENESLRGMGGGLKIISYYTYYNNYYYIEGIDLDNDPAGEKYAHQLGSYNSTQAVAESTIANALEPAGDIWLRWIPQTLQEPGGVSHPHFAFHFPAGVKYYQVTGIAYEDIDYLFCSAINWDEISVRAYYPESGTLSGTLPPNNPDPNEVPLVFIIKTNEDRYAKLKLHEAVWWEEQQGWLNQCLDPSCAVYTTGPLKFPNAQYTLDFVTY